jgi:hypothetical protein
VIRYTVDGSTPNANSPVYTGPVQVAPPLTLKAAGEAPAFLPAYPERVTTASYGAVDYEQSVVSTFAGWTNRGFVNGPRRQALFNSPTGICIDSKGNLFVMDRGNQAVRKISEDGSVTTAAAGMFRNATSICIDGADNVYVADADDCNRVWKIPPGGNPVIYNDVSFCRPGYGPFAMGGIAMAPDGTFYFGADAVVNKINSSGQVVRAAGTGRDNGYGGWGYFVSLVVDAASNLYSATDQSVFLTQPDGSTSALVGRTTIGDGPLQQAGFNYLTAIARDRSLSDGNRARSLW